jgi:hypothetical protein
VRLFIITRNVEAERDEMQRALVRAENETEARQCAANHAWDEDTIPWLSPSASTCEEVTVEGESRMIIADINRGF